MEYQEAKKPPYAGSSPVVSATFGSLIAGWCNGSTGVSEALSIRSIRVSATMLYE